MSSYIYSGSAGQPLQITYTDFNTNNSSATTYPLYTPQPLPVYVVPEPKELTPIEWLREQVAEICELARAA